MREYRPGSDLEFVSFQLDHLKVGDTHVVNSCSMDFPTMRMAICKIAKDNGLMFKTKRLSKYEMKIERIA